MMLSSHLSEIADISPMVGDLGLIRFKNIRIIQHLQAQVSSYRYRKYRSL
jgi:hypothetical protein